MSKRLFLTWVVAVSVLFGVGVSTQPALAVNLTATPSPIAFGTVEVGKSQQITVKITNITASDFVVEIAPPIGAAFSLPPLNVTASATARAGGDVYTIVQFSPTSSGSLSGTLNILKNGLIDLSVALTGTGSADTAPPAAPTGLTAAAGNRQVVLNWAANTEADLSYYIIHRSTTSGFTPASADSVGKADKLFTAFTNTDLGAGTYYFKIVAVDNSGNKSPASAQASASIAPGITLSPTSLFFGNVSIGGTGQQTVTVTNTGTDTLKVTSITKSGVNASEFSVNVTSMTVPPGAPPGLVTVTFSPVGSPGTRSASLSISHNAAGSPATVSLSGIPIVSGIVLSSTSLSFGNVDIGGTGTQTFTVSNAGGDTLKVTSIAVSGTGASQFSVSPTSVTVLPGGTPQPVTVTFTPTKVGWEQGTLSVTHNAAGSPSSVAVSGIGRVNPPSGSLTSTKIAFYSVRDFYGEIYVMNANGANQTRLTNNSTADRHPSWSPDGTKIAFSSDRDGSGEIYTMNADGTNQTRLTNNTTANDYRPSWSPDGTKIAFQSNRDGVNNAEIYIMNADGTNQTRLTNNTTNDYFPSWSPDGTKIAFTATRNGPWEIYVMNADGTGQTRLTTSTEDFLAWSPDGTKIAFRSNRDGNNEIYVMNADGTNPTRLTNNVASDSSPSWSPDGTKIAFASNRDGNNEIYVMNADGTNPTRLTTTTASVDETPSWSPFLAPVPAISLSPTSLSFDTTSVGVTSQKTLIIRNSGTQDLSIFGITVVGPDSLNFEASSPILSFPFSPVIAPGDTARVTVTFAPFSAGAKSASLSISHNAAGSPATAALSGVGTGTIPLGGPGIITTFAGSGPAGSNQGGFSGDGRLATIARLNHPSGVAADRNGNVYIVDTYNNRIRRVGPDGIITTFAGTGFWDFSGDGGQATQATFKYPQGIAVDTAGVVYIADTNNDRIRRVGKDGVITTFAGGGGSFGDGGPATQARLSSPQGVAVDTRGNVYIADNQNQRIRRVGPNGVITTFAGGGSDFGEGIPATQASLSYPNDVAVDARGNVYFTDSGRIRRVGPDGILTTFAGTGNWDFSGDGGPARLASLRDPQGVAVDVRGFVYIADAGNHRIRRVDPNGIITTFSGTGFQEFSGDGGQASLAGLSRPQGVAVNASGVLYIADSENQRIRRVGSTWTDGPFVVLSTPSLTFDNTSVGSTSQRQVTIFNVGNQSLTITGVAATGLDPSHFTASPTTATVAAGDTALITVTFAPTSSGAKTASLSVAHNAAGSPATVALSGLGIGVAPAGQGIITTFAGSGPVGQSQGGYSGDGGLAILARLSNPYGVAVDRKGNVYIADSWNSRVRRVDPNGVITTFAGGRYYSDGSLGDGGPATQANLSNPNGVAVDTAGVVYIADQSNNRIRRVGLDGIITTFAGGGLSFGDGGLATQARLRNPQGVAVDTRGNVYIADFDNQRIRRVGIDGIITTVAGGGIGGFGDGIPATLASLGSPFNVDVDKRGNIYIVESSRIRRVGLDGIITTVAGGGGSTSNGIPATQASLGGPRDVAVDDRGFIYIAEASNNRVRRVGLDGIINAFAGTGLRDFSGDGGPAPNAGLEQPYGVAVDTAGAVYIADTYNNRIRRVSSTWLSGPAIALSVSSLKFDVTQVGAMSQRTFTILNVGGGNLSITGITVVGPDSLQFTASPTTVTVAAGDAAQVTVTFAPTSTGPKSASLSIAHNAPGSPSTVALGMSAPSPDFTNSGVVDFDDFFMLAGAFGLIPTGPNARFDLNLDGKIGSADFLLFAQNFGRTASNISLAPPTSPGPNVGAGLTATLDRTSITSAGQTFTLTVRVTGASGLTSFVAEAIYDTSAVVDPTTAHRLSGSISPGRISETVTTFVAALNGAQENPAVTTTAGGTGTFVLTDTGLHFSLRVNGLSGPITGAHFHNAATGTNGGVVQPIAFNGNTASGAWAIPPAMVTELLAGRIYVNVHTATNPGGEIRGQLAVSSFNRRTETAGAFLGGSFSGGGDVVGFQFVTKPGFTTTRVGIHQLILVAGAQADTIVASPSPLTLQINLVPPSPGPNVGAQIAARLDRTSGVGPGQAVTLTISATGLSGLTTYIAEALYDSTDFADPATANRLAGALSPGPTSGAFTTVPGFNRRGEVGAAILGGSFSGNADLVSFTFITRPGFTTTDIGIRRVILRAGSLVDTIFASPSPLVLQVNPIVSTSGRVRYAKPTLEPGDPVDSVRVTIAGTGDSIRVALTDTSGSFQFATTFTGFSLTASKEGGLNNAVQGADALLVMQRTAFLAPAGPKGDLSADVNSDGTSNNADALAILRYLAFFNTGVGQVGQWRFVPGPEKGDFVAFLVGDVDHSWRPAIGAPAAKAVVSPVVVSLKEVRGKAGEEIHVPLLVQSGSEAVSTFLASLSYDPALLEYRFASATEASQGYLLVVNGETEGQIHLAAASAQGVRVDGAFVDLVFRVRQGDPSSKSARPRDRRSELSLLRAVVNDLSVSDISAGAVSIRDVPEKFTLSQNYPNPFNPVSQINFGLPEDTRVRLVIYNLLGQQVRVLVDEQMEAGYHSVAWDGRAEGGRPVGSGVYFYRLEAPGFAETKRMVLVK
ncbi:MAG: hypothetical protein A3F84_06175 [Candidatus Handelsmanbacteria bacterium RIFCSPLOWO2_12_FULL_64_10]|uniref:Fibronectin type-III domain-containing protein n=1 Tax=Handelsmanbacteria sp. (strain RIFCSPLOWO2_12_FULL_64_10) TaxID=1817868 RepID=A0A1F6D244_HANXR|nr:MAG: hypothetical protein A3F84_06175 [Candidatus Handelsmanbacteria bacterium RIFCSPLOWO2_12_FULL_64_10]